MMDERDRETAGISPSDDEEFVRQLLESAGPRPPIPQEDLDAIAAAARFAWRRQARLQAAPRRRARFVAAALAACLTLAAGLAWWWAARKVGVAPTVAWVEAVGGPVHLAAPERRAITRGEPIPLGAALRSSDRGRVSLRLAGGSHVRLDEGTRLRFTAATVLELEGGAVYVDTGAGPRTSIEVRTPLGTARDVGTRFLVRLVDRGNTLLVRVREGAVLTRQQGRAFRTDAAQELLLRRDGTATQRAAALHGPDWDWVLAAAPRFDIEGRSLQEFLDWVSRETGWQVAFADADLAASAPRIVLHGSLGELRPDQAPFAVLPGAGLDGQLEGGRLVVRRR